MAGGSKFTEQQVLALQQKGLKVNDPMLDANSRKKLGLPKAKKNYKGGDSAKGEIELVMMALGIHYLREYEFLADRKFRFDWAIVGPRIAIEYEGGIFQRTGGHTSVKDFHKDTIKYNLAVINNWRVLRYTAMNYKTFGSDIRKIMEPYQELKVVEDLDLKTTWLDKEMGSTVSFKTLPAFDGYSDIKYLNRLNQYPSVYNSLHP